MLSFLVTHVLMPMAEGDILDQILDILNRLGVLSAIQVGVIASVALFLVFRFLDNR